MLALAWLEALCNLVATPSDIADEDEQGGALLTVFAALVVLGLNICVQPLQMGIRALMVEKASASQQTRVSAWGTYVTGIGNLVGYIAGFANLPDTFNTPQLSQFQILCLIAAVALVGTVAVSCYSIQEQDSRTLPRAADQRMRDSSAVVRLAKTWAVMPVRIRRVCQVQFWAWMGWFPFLYYATT